MPAAIIDGKQIAEGLREQIARDAAALRQSGRAVCLASVIVGDDAAALSFAQSQARQAQGVGIDHRLIHLPATTPVAEVIAALDRLNADPSVSGIVLQLPVPAPHDGFALQQRIAPRKDVEGVSAANLGMLALGRSSLVPCTAAAAFECARSTGIALRGKHAVVIGRSAIVGKPLSLLVLAADATVTQCHSRTYDLPSHTKAADFLFVAVGRAGLIGAEHVRPGAVVIDVGTNRVTTGGGKLVTVGDVRFAESATVASHITPVPGGVGPVTVAMLLRNALEAARGV